MVPCPKLIAASLALASSRILAELFSTLSASTRGVMQVWTTELGDLVLETLEFQIPFKAEELLRVWTHFFLLFDDARSEH